MGILKIEAEDGCSSFPIHTREATRGFLVGRYERCDLGVSAASLSRVHALLVEHDGELWIVDTASTNGLWAEQEQIRQRKLNQSATLRLTTSVKLHWSQVA